MNHNIFKLFLSHISENKYFFVSYSVFLIAGILIFLLIPFGDDVIFINGIHTDFFDVFFVWATFVGDGLFYLIVLLPLALFKIRYSLIGFISFISSGLVAQILKRLFDAPRPKLFFGNAEFLHFVSSIEVYSHNSFPSGHSATAFSLFLLLSILVPNKKLGILFLICAVIVGISRIYLLQHFLIDVVGGSIAGIALTLLVAVFFQKLNCLNRDNWINKSLPSIFKSDG